MTVRAKKNQPLHVGNAQAFWGDRSDAPRPIGRPGPAPRLPHPGLFGRSLDVHPRPPETARSGRRLCPRFSRRRAIPGSALARSPQIDPGYQRRRTGSPRLRHGRRPNPQKRRLLRPQDRRRHRRRCAGSSPRCNLHLPRYSGGGLVGGPSPISETGRPLHDVLDDLVTANAYLGARPIAQAIGAGANLVITGRVADPSLTVGPCMAHFAWKDADYHRIAGATVAGHLIECGTQATGGISTHWLEIPALPTSGFPSSKSPVTVRASSPNPPKPAVVWMSQASKNNSFTKSATPPVTSAPMSPLRFCRCISNKRAKTASPSGAKGTAPPAQYKVGATYRAGFRAIGHARHFRPGCPGQSPPLRPGRARPLAPRRRRSAKVFGRMPGRRQRRRRPGPPAPAYGSRPASQRADPESRTLSSVSPAN